MKSLCTAILIFCLYLSCSAFASIGKITQAEGPSTITRDTGELQGSTGVGILSMDKVQTFKGKQVIDFIESVVNAKEMVVSRKNQFRQVIEDADAI